MATLGVAVVVIDKEVVTMVMEIKGAAKDSPHPLHRKMPTLAQLQV